MQVHSRLKPISLTAPTVIFVGLFVLVVFPVSLGVVFFDTWYGFYLSRFVAPELEQALGFRGGYATVQGRDQRYESYVLIVVDPKGVLGQAGVTAGDVPCRFEHGIEPGFLGRLHHARGQRIELWFCTPPNWSEKHVNVNVPRGVG